jgi:autotransporter-associated beta strand protein
MLQSGGTVTVYGDGGDPGSSFSGVVVGHTAYGYYKMTGGELNLNSGDSQWPFFFVGLNAPGVFEQTGGTVASPRAENTILGRFEEPGVMNITGGVYQESHISANNGILLGFGSSYTGRPTGSTGILNIGGGTTLATVDVTAGTVSGSVVLGEGDNGTGILNLRANGVLKAGCVTGGGYNGFDGMGIFNFHGGTLAVGTTELAPNLTSFMEGLDHACVYSEGAVVDTNGIDTTIAQVLEKPADSGIKRIDVGSGGGSGYIGTPVVLISGSATGVGATAVAVMNGDKIDHFVITNPGSGYQDTDVLTVTLSGGGYATQATATIGTGSTYFAANVSGGLTKTGLGTLTLTADNTFTGPTKVLAGALSVATIPNGGADSPLGASTSAASNLVLDGGKLLYTGADATTDRGFALGAAGGAIENAAALTFTGLVTDDGSGGGLTKDGAGTLTLAGDVGYAGDTVINDGLLQINSASAIVGKVYGAGSLAVGDGATLTATSIQVDTLTIGGTGGAALAAVPEPSVFALLALAAMSLAGIAWSKRK